MREEHLIATEGADGSRGVRPRRGLAEERRLETEAPLRIRYGGEMAGDVLPLEAEIRMAAVVPGEGEDAAGLG